MAKNIIKEIIIVLLLALAIILILGVLLYDYVPSKKIIPEKVSYITPEKVQQELQTSTDVDDAEVVITYEIDATDLNNYKKIQEYVPGKKNPFSSLNQTETTTEAGSEQTSGTNSERTTTTENTTVQKNNTSTENTGYLPDKGTK